MSPGSPDAAQALDGPLAPGEVRPLDLGGLRGGAIRLLDARVSRVTGDDEAYASWPQGKLHRLGGRLHLLYNAGAGHGTADLAVYERTSDDGGLTFSRPALVAWEAGWARGVTAWSAGVDGEGTRHAVVRLRGPSYAPFDRKARPDGTRHRLLTRPAGTVQWRVQDIDFPFAADFAGEGPVMYHGFRALDRGFECHWHMPGFACVGDLSVVGDRLEHGRLPIDPHRGRLCEATAVATGQGGIVGFLRSEVAEGARLWRRPRQAAAVTVSPVPGVTAAKSPVPLAPFGDGVIACSCDRHGDAVLRLHVIGLVAGAGPPDACTTVDLLRLASVASGPSGTGVPDLQLFDDRLVIAFGFQPAGSRRSAVYVLTARVA